MAKQMNDFVYDKKPQLSLFEGAQYEMDINEAYDQLQPCYRISIDENHFVSNELDRTYIRLRAYNYKGFLKESVKVGYIDNLTGQWNTDDNLYD